MRTATILHDMARAIYEGRNGPGCKPWSRQPETHQRPYLRDARAALAGITKGRRHDVAHHSGDTFEEDDDFDGMVLLVLELSIGDALIVAEVRGEADGR